MTTHVHLVQILRMRGILLYCLTCVYNVVLYLSTGPTLQLLYCIIVGRKTFCVFCFLSHKVSNQKNVKQLPKYFQQEKFNF